MTRGHYTRNGCKTCKARHIKCDGDVPACRKCTKTGRTCEGYDIERPMNVDLFKNDAELQSYQYFCEETRPMLGGHYNFEFWDQIVLQISASNQAIRHALAGVGDLHRGWNFSLSRVPSAFALQQCNKAIQLLTSQQLDVVPSLLACILFACFNMLQNHRDSGLEHLQSGLRILRDWIKSREASRSSSPDSSQDYIIERYFIPLFSEYEFVVGNPTADPDYTPLLRAYADRLRLLNRQPESVKGFDSLGEARLQFHSILDGIYARMEDVTSLRDEHAITACITTGGSVLRSWYRKLLFYLNCIARSQGRAFSRAADMLRLQYHSSLIWLGNVAYKDETQFDAYLADFRAIVELCSSIIKIDNFRDDGTPRVSLSFEYGILTAIALVVQRCRDPSIRISAIEVMRGIRRHEGILGSGDSSAIWKIVVWLEENGLPQVESCYDIPPERRVRIRGLDYQPGSVAAKGRTGDEFMGPPRFMFRWTTAPHDDDEIITASFPLPVDKTKQQAWEDRLQRFEIVYGLEARMHEMCSSIKMRWDARSRFQLSTSPSPSPSA